jgi:hypothetical protein
MRTSPNFASLQPRPVRLDRDHRDGLEGLLVDRDREPDHQRDRQQERGARDEQATVLVRRVVMDVHQHAITP